MKSGVTLEQAAAPGVEKVVNPAALQLYGGLAPDRPVLVLLAAGRGTRFGIVAKCVQPVCGVPLARHSIDAFRSPAPAPVICLVHYRLEEVMAQLGDDNIYVHSADPTGGTAFAAFEALSVPGLADVNPLLVISMGDRIVTTPVFARLHAAHAAGAAEADLTLLSAEYEAPRQRGKGRILRDADGSVTGILEQRDIDAMPDEARRETLDALTEANCPLYAVRAQTLRRHLRNLTYDNAQGQYYFTDIVEAIRADGGEVRTITTTVADPEYDLLCSDVTRPRDLAFLEGTLMGSEAYGANGAAGIEDAVATIMADRSAGQVAAIACQLREVLDVVAREALDFKPDRPVAVGIAGGRLRIAFMHPDMGRFFGPAWQMPIGASDADGREQIVAVAQDAEDGRIHLFPTDPQFREKLNAVPADSDSMYPGEEVADWYAYEEFGTRMAENLLLSLGYFSDGELQARREAGVPLPPTSLWVNNSMRRPFSLMGNAIASMRTLREGNLGARVQTFLGREGFRGLRIATSGNIPRGGFSSSSAVTVALKNAINVLFNLGITPDVLVHLACQAEYGTGVRAGSLDQATEQKGKFGQGALISSNPRDNYRVLGVYPVPTQRYKVLFPFSVDRDRQAWEWSGGAYARLPGEPEPTAGEMRKMTGKAAELAAVLTRLPLDTDFFPMIEDDLQATGAVGEAACGCVYDTLRELPLCATQAELRERLADHRAWYIEQLMAAENLTGDEARERTDGAFDGLFGGWRDPRLRRASGRGGVVTETGAPLRAMVAYLFGEVAKNYHLVHHPEDWIEYVTRSQRGDCAFDIDPERLPPRPEMEARMTWESASGPALLEAWLERVGAVPHDYDAGLDDASLASAGLPPLHLMRGGSFFRGLALIDLAEAMLKRAFGADAVAVRMNAAGQGDFFQVHVDTERADVGDVKDFIRKAFYRRFDLKPETEFVEPHAGGGAVGIRLSRFDMLPELLHKLGGCVHG